LETSLGEYPEFPTLWWVGRRRFLEQNRRSKVTQSREDQRMPASPKSLALLLRNRAKQLLAVLHMRSILMSKARRPALRLQSTAKR
jgi:hypothetical protein